MNRTSSLKPARRRLSPADRALASRFHASVQGRGCVVCGATWPEMDAHHVCYAQHVRAKGGDEWSLDNALPVCRDCHDAHHVASRRIPVQALLRANLEFARELLGEAAGDYFDRYYGSVESEAA